MAQGYAWPCILSRTNIQGGHCLKPEIRGSCDTNRIIYRCFLPDLTGFITVCRVTSNLDFRSGRHPVRLNPQEEIQPRYERISGTGHR